MPPKKKKGKASKLARMTDEERARYLQHRADVELEAKRRKQQLIAIFTKNKLKREEAFARINTAKLNEQWRTTLRRMKCTVLKEDVQYLWQDFEETLKTRDDFIKMLFDELVEANFDHQRFQEAHMMALDNIIEKGEERLNYLHNNFEKTMKRIETIDLEDLKRDRIRMQDSILHMRSIIYTKNKALEEELTHTRTKNAVTIHDLVYSKEESLLELKRRVYPKMESLWQEVNDIITNYEISTESKRKQYEYLKELDDAHQAESIQFPKIHSELKHNVETLRKSLMTLTQDRQETIEELKMQSELLTKRVSRMRQDMKVTQNTDAVQLKRLSVLSSEMLKDLERILDKGIELQTIARLCSDMEPDSLKVKKYSIKNLESAKRLSIPDDESLSFLKKIQGFRDHLFYAKEENTLLRKEKYTLQEENNRLRHSLRSYLMSVSRIPTIRPRTRA